MKTQKEIDNLKSQWKYDPIWDIETTEGFEGHRAELLEFRMECENQWGRERFDQLTEKAERLGVPGNRQLAAYAETLESRIADLEGRVERLMHGGRDV